MRYVLLVSNDEAAPISHQERSRRETAFVRFQDQTRGRGTTVLAERIDVSQAATTVRCWEGGDVIVSTGSNAPAGEQLTGVFVVDCENLTHAIDVATTIPTAWFGTVVVRPVRVNEPSEPNQEAGPRWPTPACKRDSAAAPGLAGAWHVTEPLLCVVLLLLTPGTSRVWL
jgi:hypothetical protein